jgi:NADPH2:quinone reductase
MRVMQAETFGNYEGLRLADIPKPLLSEGKVLVRLTAAGVSPLEHTILFGQLPRAKAPLVLGSEGAGIVEAGGGAEFPAGSRVMFTGPYGVSENGTYGEWLAVRKEHLTRIPAGLDDVTAATIPVAYLTAYMTLSLAGFQAGKTVLAPAIGGSVGNAVTQLARALGAKNAISSTTSPDKAKHAKTLGFDEVIDVSHEKLSDGVLRITEGYGSDIVIDGIGGEVLSEALTTLAMGGSLTTLGYSAERKATIDVTNLIWKRASIKSFSIFAQPQVLCDEAWKAIVPLVDSGAIKPIIAKTFPLADAADALKYLVDGRPFGKVALTI